MGNKINWEKIGIYIFAAATFFTIMIAISDLKERIAILETKNETKKEINEMLSKITILEKEIDKNRK